MNRTLQGYETIGLCVAVEAINGILNHSMFDLLHSKDEESLGAQVQFKSEVHRDLFLVRLLDFCLERGDSALTGVTGSCLRVVGLAAQSPSLRECGAGDSLAVASQTLSDWLDAEMPMTLWLGNLDAQITPSISRSTYLHIAANQAKHNLSRLTTVAKKVQELLKRGGVNAEIAEVALALEDLTEPLQDGMFVYYATWLAEMLNNVRWEIYDYLQPVFQVAYVPPGPGDLAYRFEFPHGISGDVAERWFWRFMNHMRHEPYLKRFRCSHHLRREMQ